MRSIADLFNVRGGAFTAALVLVVGPMSAGCDQGPPAPTECLVPSQVAEGAPVTHFDVRFVMGQAPITPGREVTSSTGTKLQASKARFYLSQPKLVDAGGRQVPTDLLDEAGNRLPYGVTLVDFERPESMKVFLRVPAGSYRDLALSVGVPATCESGERLNHSDASAMKAPLDVDRDMYWTWNSGYVFLKFEGRVASARGWDGFFYHVGDDKRFAALELQRDFTIPREGGAGPEIVADFERLLTSATGEARPDITNAGQRRVHGGDLADVLAENLRHSGFLRF